MSRRIEIDAEALRFVTQARDGAVSVGDVVRLQGRGDGIGRVVDTDRGRGVVKVEALPGTARALQSAMRRYSEFTGMEPRVLDVVETDDDGGVYYVLGKLLAVEYETVKDGRRLNFRHPFKPQSRPALAVSSDGKSLRILGGGFHVTGHGIVDR